MAVLTLAGDRQASDLHALPWVRIRQDLVLRDTGMRMRHFRPVSPSHHRRAGLDPLPRRPRHQFDPRPMPPAPCRLRSISYRARPPSGPPAPSAPGFPPAADLLFIECSCIELPVEVDHHGKARGVCNTRFAHIEGSLRWTNAREGCDGPIGRQPRPRCIDVRHG